MLAEDQGGIVQGRLWECGDRSGDDRPEPTLGYRAQQADHPVKTVQPIAGGGEGGGEAIGIAKAGKHRVVRGAQSNEHVAGQEEARLGQVEHGGELAGGCWRGRQRFSVARRRRGGGHVTAVARAKASVGGMTAPYAVARFRVASPIEWSRRRIVLTFSIAPAPAARRRSRLRAHFAGDTAHVSS
jgi:hypothetical protein